MEKFTCPYATKKNSFKYILCEKKLKENGTKLQNPGECFLAMCDMQENCACADGVRLKADAYRCPRAKEAPAETTETAKAPKRKKK